MRFLRIQNAVLALSLLTVSVLAISLAAPSAFAQESSGMAGVVTDASGAVLPNATVTLTNPTSGAKFTAITNGVGAYRFSELPPGQGYVATFSANGFKPVEVKNIYLTVATVRTQDAALTVGSQSSTVEVSASNSEVTIDTTTATVGNTFDVEQLNSLPVQSRSDPTALFLAQPGVSDTGAVTGARVDQNNVTLDGLDVNDFATGGASQNQYVGGGVIEGFGNGTIVGHAPVDSLEEFHSTVAGYQAATGPSSGGQFQLVTKSGTNKFHGNLNEYHRDPSLVANSWFNNDSNPIVPRNHLIQNQFGGAIGGPIIKDRLFFFFDYNNGRIVSQASEIRTVPLDSLRSGIITYCTNASMDCSTTNTLTPAQVQALDPQGIGESSTWLNTLNSRFPHSNSSAAGDGLNTGGFVFNSPDSNFLTNYVGRIDYNLNQSMKLFGRFTIARGNAVENPNQFKGDPETSPFLDKTYAAVIGHTWVIGSNKTNQVFFGETVEKYSFPNLYNPDGSTFFTFGDGADSDGQGVESSLYLQPNSQARRVPIPEVGDDFSWNRGRHTLQFGGTFKDILAHDTNVTDYNTTIVGLGGEIFGLCGPVSAGNAACGSTGENPNPSLRPADIDTTNSGVYDQQFGLLLGRIGQVRSGYNFNAAGSPYPQLTGDQRFYRYYQTQTYFQDTWKITPELTFTYGVTYQWFTVPYETRGLESVVKTTFDQYMGERISQSNASLTGPTAVPFINYYLGGKGNGSSAPPLYQPERKDFAPHIGFAWNPGFDKKAVFNASAALVYDRTIVNSIQALQDQYSYLFQQFATTSEGISGDPYDSIRTDPRLDAKSNISTVPLSPPSTPRPPYAPFVNNGVPYGLQNGGAFNETIDPSLKTPYTYVVGFGAQHSIPGDFVLKANYVGRFGRRLLSQADANQVLEFPDPKSGETFSTAFGNMTKENRSHVAASNIQTEPWFEDVLDPNLGASYGFANNTQFLYSGISNLVHNGDFGDFTQALSNLVDNNTGAFGTPYNVGMGAQFSENSFHSNKGFSSYNGLLISLQKNASHGLQFDMNYTYSHSIDNISFFANSQGDTGIGGGGLICDDIRPRECRASSDFDVRQIATGDVIYQLPIGKGKMLLGNANYLLNEAVGGWSVDGIFSRHTGYPWQTASNAYVASYSNDAPAILTGNAGLAQTKLTKLPNGGGVSDFPNASVAAAQYTGPVGFSIGPRNSERGPGFFNMDLGLAKTFPIVAERVNLKFRADAFNALNHPNFTNPAENVYNGYDQEDYQGGSTFGQISFQNGLSRILQLSLRLEF